MNLAIKGRLYPPGFQYPACPVDIKLRENDTIRVGDLSLKVLNTNGHSRGHISLYWEENGRKHVFCGDTVFARGRVVMQNIWDCSIEQYAETVAKLHALRLDCLYPGHGPFLLHNAGRHVEWAQQYFDRLEIPFNY